MLGTKPIQEELSAIAGGQNVRAALPEDAVYGVLPQWVVEPETGEQLAAALSCANAAGIAAVPRGGGTKMDWGNPPKRADLILSTARLHRIVEHAWADLTVTVEAGCALQSLQSTLAEHGQRLAFDGLWPEHATVGGVLSTNDSGVLRLRFGSLRDLIIGVTLALPDGTLAKSGGKVVKNVAGYDLPKLATGALGTLGIITRAVFRLHPLPWGARTLSFATDNAAEMQQLILAIQGSQLAHTALQFICAAGDSPRADILFEGTKAGLDAQEAELRKLLGSTSVQVESGAAWNRRQELADSLTEKAALAKLSFLPADFAAAAGSLQAMGSSQKIHWQGVFQATGIGTLRLDGEIAQLGKFVEQLRSEAERRGGSLVVLRRPAGLRALDSWGNPGDALPLMQAVKHRLDPKNTLNPGRFVGGI